VARAMGWRNAFAYDRPADIFREHARLSTYRNGGRRLFDLGASTALTNAEYEALEPFRWGATPFADGRFPTSDGKARLVPVEPMPLPDPLPKWPMTLNSGRYRDQWHTMTRTGLSPRLSQHRREPLAEIHPLDGEAHGIGDGDLVRVTTPQGESVYRAAMAPGQRRSEVFVPIHWTDRQSSGGRTGRLPRPLVDPHSGQPGFKSTPARIEKLAFEWQGFLIARALPQRIGTDYFTAVRVEEGWLVELAGNQDPELLTETLLPQGKRAENIDYGRGNLRVAVLDGGRVAAAFYVARDCRLPDREWLIGTLAAATSPPTINLLAGRPAMPQVDRGAIVCACFDIGLKTIVEAIGSRGLMSVEEVGLALSAGTNCGSCRPAIRRLIGECREAAGG